MKIIFMTLLLCLGLMYFFQPSPSYSGEDNFLPVLQVFGAPEPGIVFTDEENNLAGIVGGKVQSFLDQTGVAHEIRLVPFVLGYRETLARDDAIIFNITRTPPREDLFEWIFPMGGFVDYLIALNTSEFNNITKEQILSGQYRVLCERGAVECRTLREFGFAAENIITLAEVPFDELARMLLRGRADFIVGDLDRLNLSYSTNQLSRSSFVNVMEIDQGRAWIAAGKSIDPRILELLLAASKNEE
jgi:polar amino acid transport system substrate-binding protein